VSSDSFENNREGPASSPGGTTSPLATQKGFYYNMSRHFVACKEKVLNRGKPPDSFLNELIDWAKQAPDDIFTKNQNHDVYTNVAADLGPFSDLLHRKAVMLEVLRVLGGFESSWDFREGVDVTNPTSNTPCTEEAGIFQISGNAMEFHSSLKDLLRRTTGGHTDCETFKTTTKENHRFAFEFCARLLRFTVNHHGPVKRKEINPFLRRDAVSEFRSFLTEQD
jgi:hypothetical protein